MACVCSMRFSGTWLWQSVYGDSLFFPSHALILSLLKHLASTDVDISYNAAQELTMVLFPLFPQDGVGVERAHGELLSQIRLVHPQANHVLCHLVEHMETEYTRWQTPLMILQTLKDLSCLVPQSDVVPCRGNRFSGGEPSGRYCAFLASMCS
ncbi:hypothetical protein KSD_71310 [Ktedonobacter sp. SOSP1-85]|nr:hypothetical protein KSD_71310 [Ktedonobacter sp. SOSP1-85]